MYKYNNAFNLILASAPSSGWLTDHEDLVSKSQPCYGSRWIAQDKADKDSLALSMDAHTALALFILAKNNLTNTCRQ